MKTKVEPKRQRIKREKKERREVTKGRKSTTLDYRKRPAYHDHYARPGRNRD